MALQYLHSHVASEINDNSTVSITTDGGTVGFFPIFADKGKDNELVMISNGVNEFYKTYGIDGARFGQAHLNVVNWLMGGGTACIMRLLPEDASYASAALVVTVDSYVPEYVIKVSIKQDENNTLEFGYKVGEDWIFEGSTIKELKIVNYDSNRGYFDIGNASDTAVGIFRTGRGSNAEEDYDIDDDWMRNNGYALEGDPDEADDDGILPIKSYVNYTLVDNIFKLLFTSGTRAFSPTFSASLVNDPVAGTFFDKENPVILFDNKEVTVEKLGCFNDDNINDEIQWIDNAYVLKADGKIVSGFDPDHFVGKIKHGFVPTYFLNKKDDNNREDPENYRVDNEGYLSGEWVFYFEDNNNGDDLKAALLAMILAPKTKEAKTQLFADPTKVVAYYDISDTAKEKYENGDITVEVNDRQVRAAYFLDGYPIEVYPTGAQGDNQEPLYNARITVNYSDTGTSIERVIFVKKTNSGISTDGYTKDTIYTYLDILSKFAGVWPERSRDALWIDTQEDNQIVANYTLDNENKYNTTGNYEASDYYNDHEPGIEPLKFSMINTSLHHFNYTGAKKFTKKNADKVTVSVVNVPASESRTRDAVKLYLKEMNANYNTNSNNILNNSRMYVLGYFISNCRGEYYNNYKILLNINNNLRETYSFRLYDIEIYDTNNGNTKLIDGPFTVALDKDALDLSGASYYIKSIFDTYGESDVTYYDDVDEKAFKNLSNDLSSLFRLKHPAYVFDTASVDPLFIPQVDEITLAQGNEDYEFHSYLATTDDENIPSDQRVLKIQGDNNISTATSAILSRGFNLGGGSSGSLFDRKGNLINSVKRNLLMQTFTGSLNPDVTDKWNYEFDVILDAGYPNVVKNRMVQLASSLRGDCIVCLDTDNMLSSNSGQANSCDNAVKARRAFAVSDYVASIWSQNTVAYDEYSGRDIPVSATYLLAYKIPSNDKNNGIQTSFVGPRRGNVTLTSPLNWYPTTVEKEKLYKAQINYISKYPDKTIFDNQLTSQVITSALSNIPNVRVLFKMRRACEKIADNFRFERNTGYTRFQLQDYINNYLKTWVENGACESATASVKATDYMIKQKMCQVEIALVFVGFLERILITFNVNG